MITEPNLQPVTDTSELKRDLNNTALLAVDVNSLNAYKRRKHNNKKITDDINMLKNDMTEIKSLLSQLIGKING